MDERLVNALSVHGEVRAVRVNGLEQHNATDSVKVIVTYYDGLLGFWIAHGLITPYFPYCGY
jgi:hypothetical protein